MPAQKPKLDQLSDAELQAELDRRAKAKITIPPQLPKPDFKRLITCAQAGLEEAVKQGRMNKDQGHFLAEEVYKAIYGPDFYEWYNKAGLDY